MNRVEMFHDDTLGAAEFEKYERMWSVPEYSDYSPGETLVDTFMEMTGAQKGDSVIDLGCGTGRATSALQEKGLRATGFDITPKGLQETIHFRQGCLWRKIGGQYDHGYCCDVMEHIPIEFTMLVLHQISLVTPNLFLQICNIPDGFGRAIGEPLHLSVMPFQWWKAHLESFGEVLDARDLLTSSVFHVRFA